MEKIQAFLGGVGVITREGEDMVTYRVSSLKDLAQVVIPHLDKYPLLTQKLADFEQFKVVVEMLKRKEHLTNEGLQQIVNIRASVNDGLPDTLISAFPNTIPVLRRVVVDQQIQDPNWLAGFADGEGCFFVEISKSSTSKSGLLVRLNFSICQHSRDLELMNKFETYLGGCGKCYSRPQKDMGEFSVRKISDITEIIIPFFEKYPLHGNKKRDFSDFRKVAQLIKDKAHLTKDGFEKICKIKEGMNRGRSN